MLVVQEPGTPTRLVNVVVLTTFWLTLPLLLMTSVAVTVLPGPVQASGSLIEVPTRSTVIVKLHEAVLLAASATVQVTVVTPMGKLLPEAGAQTGVPTPGQLSVAVAFGYVTVLPAAEVAPTAKLAEQMMAGA